MKPCIVTFVGTVGAGKSTQIKLLAFKLKSEKQKVKTTVLKRGHFITHILEVVLAKLLVGSKANTYPIRVIIEERPLIFKKLFCLFLFLDTISIFLRFLLTIYLPKKLNYTIIVEESIQGALSDYIHFAEFVGFTGRNLSRAVNLLLRLTCLAGPTFTIFLDSPNETLKNRWLHRHSLSQRSDYLHMQRTLLFSISKKTSDFFIYLKTNDKTIQKTSYLLENFLNGSMYYGVQQSQPYLLCPYRF